MQLRAISDDISINTIYENTFAETEGGTYLMRWCDGMAPARSTKVTYAIRTIEMSKFGWLYVAYIGLSMVGCASVSEIKEQRIATLPEDQRTYVIGRYAVECMPHNDKCGQVFNDISVYYLSSAGDRYKGFLNSTQGNIFGGDTVYDFVSPELHERGYYFCEIFPSGEHAFNSFRYYNFAGGGSGYSLRKESEFRLPFTTEPGEVVYVGRLKLTTETGRNILGMKLPAPGILLLSNAPQIDIPLALEKCPEAVRSAHVRDAPLHAAMAKGHMLVQDEPPEQ